MRTTVPKIIWMLWLQGWDRAPRLATACRQSWERAHPDWDVRAIALDDVVGLPGVLAIPEEFPAARSDLIRAHLLNEHGGVWVDATAFCVHPLDDWLGHFARSGFFAFDSPGYGRMISSWFLAADPQSYLMSTWAASSEEHWRGRSELSEYFWFHRLFGDLYRSDPAFRADWDAVPRMSAAGPHYFAPYGPRFTASMTRRTTARLARVADPVYKLNGRVDLAASAPDSAHRYFVDGARQELAPSAPWAALDQAVLSTFAFTKARVNAARSTVAVFRQSSGE